MINLQDMLYIFFVNFEILLLELQMYSDKKKNFILGDFNVWMNHQYSADANKFRSIVNNFSLNDIVNKATHKLRVHRRSCYRLC